MAKKDYFLTAAQHKSLMSKLYIETGNAWLAFVAADENLTKKADLMSAIQSCKSCK